MKPIQLTPRDVQLIEQWYETDRERSGHFGDGAVTTPDEDIVLGKLGRPGPYEFFPHQLDLIVQWAESSVHTAITPDEYSLLEKILAAQGRTMAELKLQKPR